jgi:protein-L-isoaspartate(D-aspartate) O-methyltransferase
MRLRLSLTTPARTRLDALGVGNVRLETADALAYEPGRKFDAVAVTGAVATIPAAFGQWLKPGGRLFIVHGASPAQAAVRGTFRGGQLHLEGLFETDIPYLRGAEPVPRFTL